MKEIRTIVRAYNSIDFTQTQAALATVVRVEGSSYRRAGARMLVLDDGTYLGGISGGCLEGDALRRAQKGIMLGRSSVITYDTTQDDDYQIGVGLGCEGIIDVLFTPLRPDDVGNPLRILAGLIEIRQPEILLTVTGAPDPGLLGRTVLSAAALGDGEVIAQLEADICQCLLDRTSGSVKYGEITIFIEVMLPAIHLVAYGGNYDIRTLLQQSKELGWDSTIVLNTSRVDRGLIGSATRVMDSKDPGLPFIDAHTAVLLMSHDYRSDLLNLQKVLPSSASYIGLLGPRKRADKIFDALAAEGSPLTESDLQRIYAPAGLDIGAANPEEIALSILAEIRSHFSGRKGMPLRLREGSIYGHPL